MGTLKADTIQNTSGGAVTLTNKHAAKVWVQYLQATPVVSNSFNVSSVTDESTGLFQVNYTNAFDSTAYGRSMMSNDSRICGVRGDRDATHTQFGNRSDAGSIDDTACYGAMHGDLA